jgi:hypothetical protein
MLLSRLGTLKDETELTLLPRDAERAFRCVDTILRKKKCRRMRKEGRSVRADANSCRYRGKRA